ncbi:MAG: class I SAM-dependent methyltransferase [Candidatus Lokiarchaeia archaeon]
MVQWVLIGFLILFVYVFVILKIIRHYYHFPIPGFFTQLIDNPYRRRFIQKPGVLAERMQLNPGMIVVEIGPGKGNYTKAVAEKLLPDGKVYAIDIQESVIERLKRKIEKEGITNIVPKIDDAYNLSFADESVDRVLAIAVLPEIPEPVKVLREFHRILKPDGLVCLCELLPDPDYPRRSTEKRWAAEAGFELRQEFGNFFVYQLNFGKKSE